MLNLFGFKKNYFVGVDFGTSAIKIVELAYKDRKVHLVNYGWVNLENSPGGEPREQRLLSFDDKLKLYLQNLVNKMNLKSNSVYVSLPAFVGLLLLTEFPEMNSAELEKAVHYEMRKYIPNALDEFSIGWEIVNKKGDSNILVKKNSPGKLEVLMVAAPRKEIERYQNIVGNTRLEIRALELETFAIARSLTGDDLGTFLIADIGARTTNMSLVEKGVIRINRSVSIGGNEVTNSIAESLSISRQRAEALKKENRDILNSREAGMVIPPLEMIVSEAKRIIMTYQSKNPEGRINSVILSGGSAKLKGLDEYFSKMLGIPAAPGKPWRKIVVDEKLVKVVEAIGTSYSVALGLALRGVDEYQRG